MYKLLESKIEPELIEELRLISRQQGTSVANLVNLALKEFIASMEDETETYRLPQKPARLALATAR